MVSRGCVAHPTHLELVATVAQVAGNGNDINPLVRRNVVDIASLSVTEEDVLYSMEAKKGVT